MGRSQNRASSLHVGQSTNPASITLGQQMDSVCLSFDSTYLYQVLKLPAFANQSVWSDREGWRKVNLRILKFTR